MNRNFHLADLVTIMNGVCGAFSIFSSARYLVTGDPNYLWTALWLPLAGCMFDLFDGKIARWRKASSMLGQELDSLADLVRNCLLRDVTPPLTISLSRSPLALRLVCWPLWSGCGRGWTPSSLQVSSAAVLHDLRGSMPLSLLSQKIPRASQTTSRDFPFHLP